MTRRIVWTGHCAIKLPNRSLLNNRPLSAAHGKRNWQKRQQKQKTGMEKPGPPVRENHTTVYISEQGRRACSLEGEYA